MDWSEVAGLLTPWRNYWVCTVAGDGAPHAAPVWGVVLGEVLFFFTEQDTVKARNLAGDPRVVIHSESGDDVLIVRGTARVVGRPREHPGVIEAFAAKYTAPGDAQYLPAAGDRVNEIYAVSPTSAMTWELDAYEGSQRRWAAPAEPIVRDASS
jgi:PPOX class probable F420-dependent enzyme